MHQTQKGSNLDLKNLEAMISKKLISKELHETEPLILYSYTKLCQAKGIWNRETLACRGLVMDNKHQVIARPPSKFFNFEEIDIAELPTYGTFKAYEKADGSLVILFNYNNNWFITTRGSFKSEQSLKAYKLLANYNTSKLDKDFTYFAEVIYKQNRIVVDYQDLEQIRMIGARHTKDGWELDLAQIDWPHKVEEFGCYNSEDALSVIEMFQQDKRSNFEGFVFTWANGFRVKLKQEEYLKLHRVKFGLTPKRIFDVLKVNKLQELIDSAPEEFKNTINQTASDINNKRQAIIQEAYRIIPKDLTNRKDIARSLGNHKLSKLAFAIHDGHLTRVEKISFDMAWEEYKQWLKQQ